MRGKKKVIQFTKTLGIIALVFVLIIVLNPCKCTRREMYYDIYFNENNENNWGINYYGEYSHTSSKFTVNNPKQITDIKRECVVAVIDSGCNIDLPEIKKYIWNNHYEIKGIRDFDDDKNGYIDDKNGWNFCNNDSNIESEQELCSHGTQVANVITQVFPSNALKIMPVVVLHGEDAKGNVKDIIKAIKYAESNGAVICNLSLCSEIEYYDLKKTMEESNMLFVVAGGNKGDEQVMLYPCCWQLDNCISVAATDENGKLCDFSYSRNDFICVAAPGADISAINSAGSIENVSGSSIAAAFVSGEAAVIYSTSDRIICNNKLYERIVGNCTKIDDLKDKVISGGIINIQEAIMEDD